MNGETSGKKTTTTKPRHKAISIMTLVVILLAALTMTLTRTCREGGAEETDRPRPVSDSTIIMAIQSHSRLYTAETTCLKTIRYSADNAVRIDVAGIKKDIGLPMSRTEYEIPVRVTYKAFIDLEKIRRGDIVTISSSTIVGGVTQTDAVTPTGTITPRTITASIGKTLTKTYDTLANTYYTYGSNEVGGTKLTSDDITITSNNLVNDSDKASIFTDTVMDAINASGKYGYRDASGTFHESADVLTDDSVTKTAQFTGVSSGSNNYKLSTDPVYADGSAITPYEITDIDLATNTITKVYDAKSNLATSADNQNAATTAKSYISGISATHNGQTINLSYDTNTDGDVDAYYIHKTDDSSTETRNVSGDTAANAARFLLTINTDSPNYTVADSLKNSDGKVQLDTAAVYRVQQK